MPEFRNPNLQPQSSGEGGPRNLLVFALLTIAVLFGYQYLAKPTLPVGEMISQTKAPVGECRPQMPVRPELSTARGEGQIAAPTVAAALETETTARSLKPPAQFGWLTVIAKPLYLALRALRSMLGPGANNWGWAIIIVTVIFNLVLLPTRMWTMRSSLKMMRIQPKVDALKHRYAHLKPTDPKKAEMNTEMMQFFKKEGVNMYGGCLPMLMQMPLLVAYVRVLQNAIELRQAHWFWLTDLSLPDPLHILPILIIGTMFLAQYITPTPNTDPNQRRLLAVVMPLIMGFALWRYASGLALYWATCNLFSLIFQFLVNRSNIGKEMQAIATERGMANQQRPDRR